MKEKEDQNADVLKGARKEVQNNNSSTVKMNLGRVHQVRSTWQVLMNVDKRIYIIPGTMGVDPSCKAHYNYYSIVNMIILIYHNNNFTVVGSGERRKSKAIKSA